jgi:hypothetical protein
MARPVWIGAQKLLGEAKTSTVVLLDNSYSMEAGRAGLANFSIARDEATRILADLNAGSDASRRVDGRRRQRATRRADLRHRATHARRSPKLDAGFGTATVPSALGVANGVFGQMHESARQLVVLTDFQRVSFEATEDRSLGEKFEQLKKAADRAADHASSMSAARRRTTWPSNRSTSRGSWWRWAEDSDSREPAQLRRCALS